jgi:hypothetical protein
MKSFLRLAIISAILLGAAAIPARADSGATLSYALTGPVSATWTMSQDPTTLFPKDGIAFVVDVPDLVVGGAATPDMIVFFSLGDMGGVNSVTDAIPDLIGPELYTGSETNPVMLTGIFNLINSDTGAAEVLTVKKKAMPEPGTLLLLSAGLLVVAGFKRKSLLAPVR